MLRTYYLLTKPGIIFGNLITMTAGFLLGSRSDPDLGLFLATLAGLGLIIASACVFNNYIDRDIDKKMKRTKKRALASGLVSGRSALLFGTTLGISGVAILKAYTNDVALVLALIGFFVYVVMYGFWKRRSTIGTVVGSISGAIPPVVGYCAASNNFDTGALIFFLILVLWQMPHFYSIAMYRRDDYAKAGIPALPVKKGMEVTKIHILIFIVAYIVVVACLTLFDYTGNTYLVVGVVLGLIWLGYGIAGFKTDDDIKWARKMFRVSLIVLSITSVMIGLDSLLP